MPVKYKRCYTALAVSSIRDLQEACGPTPQEKIVSEQEALQIATDFCLQINKDIFYSFAQAYLQAGGN